jgi:hypothetical protein
MSVPHLENRSAASRLAAAHEVAKALRLDPAQPGSARLADALAKAADSTESCAALK